MDSEPGSILRRLRQFQPAPGAVALLGLLALSALVTVLPVQLAAIVGALAIAVAAPASAVAAVPFVLGLPYQPIELGGPAFAPPEVMIGITAAAVAIRLVHAAVARGAAAPRDALRLLRSTAGSGFGPIAVALLVVGIVSLFTIADPDHQRESLREFRWVIVEPVAYYLIAAHYLRERRGRHVAAASFLAGGAFVAVWALVSLLSGGGVQAEGVTRLAGPYPHPNGLALFIERPLVLAMVFVAGSQRGRAAVAPAAALSGVAIVLTFSRGALIAAALAILAALLALRRYRAALVGVAVAGAGAVVLFIGARDRLLSLFAGGSGSLRLSIWRSSVEMIRDRPIFGVGLDQFLYQYAPRYVEPVAWSERFTSHPHNIILDLWLRLGIMGLGVGAAYVVVFLVYAHRVVRGHRALGVGAAAAVLAGTFHGLVDNGYFLPDLAMTLWFLTALLHVEAASVTSPASEPLGERRRRTCGYS